MRCPDCPDEERAAPIPPRTVCCLEEPGCLVRQLARTLCLAAGDDPDACTQSRREIHEYQYRFFGLILWRGRIEGEEQCDERRWEREVARARRIIDVLPSESLELILRD